MENIISLDSNGTNGSIANENLDCIKITHKNGVDNVRDNEVVSEYNDDDNDNDDELSEFIAYRDNEFESDNDDLEHSLDFKFDFDIIFTPEKNSELLQITEIKSKIVNRIKLHALDLSHIKTLDNNEKFDLIKLFNHMV